ncbi:hypothetical protein OG562_39990 [Streptomyces sp. NBC_01275]|uniref:hypothetical protein n=1 Tax=Streptomyces sp. NBC_01275 TaxID=2903807 RepID=UPI00225907D7|nr:hypothetical protein [Streptomyces sp. NBC_01275]MCX4767044.1 hypothetical protein [Streptomyces sp. NBC_01275]
MATRRTKLRTLLGAAVLPLALVSPAWGGPSAPDPVAEGPETLCAPAGVLQGPGGQRAQISLCAGSGTPTLAVSAPAGCRSAGSGALACLTSGSWTARRDGETVSSGTLPGSGEYPGPGVYDVTATVRVRSTPAGVDLTGTVHATLTLTAPKPQPTHRIEVDRTSLAPNSVTTLTYTVSRDSERGDGSARFGLIGEEASGMTVTTSDARCVNPLTGSYPASTRNAYALDCALTDLQPGRPSTVVVQVAVKDACSTVVSKLGYWMPQGQALFTGGMLAGPTVTCA